MKTILLSLFLCFSFYSFGQFLGQQQEITGTTLEASDVHSADLDGDGDMDILSASQEDDKIAWYENDGVGNFGVTQVISSDASGAHSVYTSDLDGDGDIDVLSASRNDDKIAWYENDGLGNFGPQQVISTVASSANSVYTSDLDGDGDMDVLSASFLDDKIAWYENDGLGNFGPQQIVSTEANGANSVYTSDLDGDGDIDVLSASWNDNKIAWYENDGVGNFSAQQVISSEAYGARSVYSSDLDGDGDLDVLSASFGDDKIAWYENDGVGNFGPQQVISSEADGAGSVYSSDLDGDGDLDVLSASWYDDKIAWYQNDGAGNFGLTQVISSEADGAWSVYTSDLDGDGDIDVLSASQLDDKIAWYENLTGEGCTDTEACNFDTDAWIDNGSCCYTDCGCIDPIAENYSDTAECENNTCEYIEGCSNSLAINYNPNVTLDIGSCSFKITGTVFYDENENGIMDGAEYGLPFQTITIEALGLTYITNDQGNFIANLGSQSLAFFELSENPLFPYFTTLNIQSFDASSSTSTNLMFGISNEFPEFGICIDLYPSGNGFLCNDYSNHNICFRNMGNVPIDGIVEVEYDDLFQGHQEVTPIDSVNGNKVYMSFANLLPGEMFFYDIDLLTPTVDHIGEYITSHARIYGYYEGEQVAYGEQELTMEVACAYDPNDKQAFPLGYTDEHWLLPETEQEFLVRFQNTGNAPAQDVRIQDTIDVNFDLSTLKIVANSHSVMTSINSETRVVDFFFENIQLPDSVNNEPDSHGLISYKITPHADLSVGTGLINTAFIYFDNNDAIVTNTTWTTIHECGGEAAFDASEIAVCPGEEIIFTSLYEEIDSYQWNIDSAPEAIDSTLIKTFNDAGEYIVQLVAENPLCQESTMQVVNIHENPSAEFTSSNTEICTGETIEFENEDENLQSHQWSIDASVISQEQLFSETFSEAGEFTVELTTMNEFCSDSQNETITVFASPSAEFTSSNTEICAGETIEFENEDENAQAFQWLINNEEAGEDQLLSEEFSEAGEYTIELTTVNEICSDSQSETIIVYGYPSTEITEDGAILTAADGENYLWFVNSVLIPGATNQSYEALEDGSYSVVVIGENGCTVQSEETMVVSINEMENSIVLLYPNPMTDVAYIDFENTTERTIKMVDSTGKEVRVWNNIATPRLEIKKGDLSAGNYFIQIQEGTTQYSVKLIIE